MTKFSALADESCQSGKEMGDSQRLAALRACLTAREKMGKFKRTRSS
jgi:hypothetical protein